MIEMAIAVTTQRCSKHSCIYMQHIACFDTKFNRVGQLPTTPRLSCSLWYTVTLYSNIQDIDHSFLKFNDSVDDGALLTLGGIMPASQYGMLLVSVVLTRRPCY